MRDPVESIDPNEPLDRLEERALEGLRFGMAVLRRLRRTLPRWMRKGGQLDESRCVAAIAAVQTALATMSPLNMQRLARKIRRRKAA